MKNKEIEKHARNVARLASALQIRASSGHGQAYSHMGALLSDAILQAGVNYRTVVAPRVYNVLRLYPEAVTSLAFKAVLASNGPGSVLQWMHPEKPRRLQEFTDFLVDNCVYTTNAFRLWLLIDANLEKLAALRGIGPKTIDYLRNLCGIETIAVDRHIRAFVLKAGVPTNDYVLVRRVVEEAADVLAVSRSELDRAIWKHESEKAALPVCNRTKRKTTH